MKKIIGFLNTGMAGCSVAEAFVFHDDTLDSVIDLVVHEAGIEWAQSYRDIVFDEVEETDEYVEGCDFEYAENIESYWEVYNGDDHDGERSGGGSFEDDFARMM